jgi:DNA-directed RNA polymerase subunit M/transcription elongation factor TFIIS
MALPKISLYLQCSSCDRVEYCDVDNLLRKLRSVQMLRRNVEPDEELIRELIAQAADRLPCPKCDSHGVSISDNDPFDDDAWGDPKKCERCSAKIPPERLEVFPDTKLCMKCQSGEERGESSDEPDFCPRCGDVLQMKRRTGGGLAGYRMVCPSCTRR